MQQISGETLGEYVENVFSTYKKGDDLYDVCIDYILADEIKSFEELRQFVLNKLYCFVEDEEESDEDIQRNEQEVDTFFKVSIRIFGKGANITTDILLKICEELKCDISDIVEVVPDAVEDISSK